MKFISACLIFFVACQDPSGSPSSPSGHQPDRMIVTPAVNRPADTTTLGGKWYLEPVLASDTATGKTPWLEFDLARSRFTGNTGCNQMRGKFWFSKTDSSLSFADKLRTTKMSCPGYNEPAFLKSMHNTGHYSLRGGVLTLIGDDHTELSHWMRKREAASRTEKT